VEERNGREERQEQWLEELLRTADDDTKMTEKQLRIVNAAMEVFVEKGYSGSSTSEIAAKAGVAEGTIFRHYKTKKDLLFSIVTPIVAKLVAPFVMKDFYRVLDAPYSTYESFLRAVLRNRIDFIHKHLPALRIFLQEIPFQEELREPFKDMVAANIIPRLRNVAERFQAQGSLRVDFPPESIVRLTMTNILGFLLARYFLLPEYAWDDEAEIERTIDFIIHGLGAPRA